MPPEDSDWEAEGTPARLALQGPMSLTDVSRPMSSEPNAGQCRPPGTPQPRHAPLGATRPGRRGVAAAGASGPMPLECPRPLGPLYAPPMVPTASDCNRFKAGGFAACQIILLALSFPPRRSPRFARHDRAGARQGHRSVQRPCGTPLALIWVFGRPQVFGESPRGSCGPWRRTALPAPSDTERVPSGSCSYNPRGAAKSRPDRGGASSHSGPACYHRHWSVWVTSARLGPPPAMVHQI